MKLFLKTLIGLLKGFRSILPVIVSQNLLREIPCFKDTNSHMTSFTPNVYCTFILQKQPIPSKPTPLRQTPIALVPVQVSKINRFHCFQLRISQRPHTTNVLHPLLTPPTQPQLLKQSPLPRYPNPHHHHAPHPHPEHTFRVLPHQTPCQSYPLSMSRQP